MKVSSFILLLLLLAATHSHAQNANAYQVRDNCLRLAQRNREAALEASFQHYAYASASPLGATHSARDGWPGIGYKCRAHGRTYCNQGCAQSYYAEVRALDNALKQSESACENRFETFKTLEENSIAAQLERERQKKKDIIKSYENSNTSHGKSISHTAVAPTRHTVSHSGKYAFVVYQFADNEDVTTGLYGVAYVSEVVNMELLDCSNSRGRWQAAYSGVWPKHKDCAEKWFVEILARKFNITSSGTSTWCSVYMNDETKGAECLSKDEEVCYFYSRADAEKVRREFVAKQRAVIGQTPPGGGSYITTRVIEVASK